jgi:surfactin synthase thioesterase subunit
MTSQPACFPQNSQILAEAVTLLCFPHAGGGTALYHRWCREAPTQIQIVPICLPGRERRYHEPAHQEWQSLLAEVVPAVQGRFLQPVWLFGHSLGALTAFQVATELVRLTDRSVAGLIVSSCPAPTKFPRKTRRLELEDDDLLATLVADYGFAGERVDQELRLMEMIIPTIRADLSLVESYQPTEPLARFPIVLAAGGVQDRSVHRFDLEEWRFRATDAFKLRSYPGGHFYLVQSSSSLLRWIADYMVPKRNAW